MRMQFIILALLAASTSFTQAPPGGGRPGGGRPGGGQAAPADQAPANPKETYQKIVDEYTREVGALNTLLKGDVLLFEIPTNMMGREFLWYSELKSTPSGAYSGSEVGSGVFKFEKRDDKVLVRGVDYSTRATGDEAMKFGVAISNVQPIIAALDVKATSPEGAVLVDVSRFFKQGIPEMPFASSFGGANIDPSRTFIDKVHAFPDNINIEVTATATSGGATSGLGRRNPFGGAPARPSNTATIHHSMVLLPEKPMMGRLADSRVGYFSYPFTVFSSDEQGSKEQSYISRYRLEKKNPELAVSDPVKPIIYYIAPEVPQKWRPYIKQGVEDWKEAFEKAGFKNAIRCEDAPKDPKWSPEDVRYSTIRWAPLPIENAMGPHVADPRSGEILSAHVILWHDVLKLATQWYFAQASPNDKRAQRFPFPDDLTGECLRFVVAHEVGHTLGLPHNGKSSAMVPVENLRNKAWTDENGTAGSIMDYARFNYVAQPGDNARLMPKIGVYDIFSIEWGYKPIEWAQKPDDEVQVLDTWAARQVTNPLLRFYDNFSSSDPTAMSEALGDDAVVASTYGIANLKRVMSYLMPATVKLGEDYEMLSESYGSVWGQYNLYIGHVMAMIGGVVQTDYRGLRGGNVYSPVPKQRQRAAVKWLCDEVLQTPEYLLPNTVLAKLSPASGAARLKSSQRRAISGMLSESRIQRMLDNQIMYGDSAYTVSQMMVDIRESAWAELVSKSPMISRYRMSMQRTLVNSLIGVLSSSSSDLRAYALAELGAEQQAIRAAAQKTSHAETKQHLNDMDQMIDMALKFPPQVAAPAATAPTFPFGATAKGYCDLCKPLEEQGASAE